MKVSILSFLFDEQIHEIGVDKALERIKVGKSREKVEQIRNGDKSLKKHLPVVLFSGTFNKREDVSMIQHSGFIVLDFDNITEVEDAKMKLATDEYSYATWISPSGNGVKVLVRITNPEHHHDHFRALLAYHEKPYGLELHSSGSNLSRACSESYDQIGRAHV